MTSMTRRGWIAVVVMALLAILPPVFYLTGNAFYLDLAVESQKVVHRLSRGLAVEG